MQPVWTFMKKRATCSMRTSPVTSCRMTSCLIAMPNVIVTSHQAFLTNEALDNIAATTINNLVSFFSGNPDTSTEVCYHK